jgi:hypothetical protein
LVGSSATEGVPLKMRGILGSWDSKEGIFLNRKIRFEVDGSGVFEADSEHMPKMLNTFGLEGCNSSASGSKRTLGRGRVAHRFERGFDISLGSGSRQRGTCLKTVLTFVTA